MGDFTITMVGIIFIVFAITMLIKESIGMYILVNNALIASITKEKNTSVSTGLFFGLVTVGIGLILMPHFLW